jgi:hypothetical protein
VTEEDYYCAEDMGLTQTDTTNIHSAYMANMASMYDVVAKNGGWSWQQWTAIGGAPPQAQCAAWFRGGDAHRLNTSAFLMEWTNSSAEVLPFVMQDLATFLLVRGDFAWIGFSWIGCSSNAFPGHGGNYAYPIPDELSMDVGMPLAPYSETGTGTGVFTRAYTKVTVQMDCNKWVGTISPTAA